MAATPSTACRRCSSSSLAIFLIVVFMGAYAATGAFAATYVVGDNRLWMTMPQNPTAYTDWASRQRFIVGDTLVFNFATDSHNVLQVSRADFENCNTQNPVASYINGPATVTLNRGGDYYFICGVPAHCSQLRQRMTLTVAAVPTSSTRPAPPPTAGGPTIGTPPATNATPPPTSTPSIPSSPQRPSGAASSNGRHGKAAIAAVALTASVAALLL